MALPTQNDIDSLQFSMDGSPWFRSTAKSSLDTESLQYSMDGSPWWSFNISSTLRRLKIYINNNWVEKPLKYFNGSDWVEKVIKYYNSTWQ